MPKRTVLHGHRSSWPAESAGRHMTTSVPTATPSQTLGSVQKELHAMMKHLDTINYIYVLDARRRFLGMLSIKELYRHTPATTVERVYKRRSLVSVKPTTDQEKVAYAALNHNIKAVPVVEHDGTFLGAVPSDAILSILHRELHEDMLRRAGVIAKTSPFDNVLTLPISRSVWHRMPWLLIGLLGGLGAAGIVGGFEETLQKNLVLAAFIPLLVYMTDAVGTQMEAFVIRDLAVNHNLPFLRYVMRQCTVVTVIALIFSGLLWVASAALGHEHAVSTTLSVSLFAGILSSVFTGLLIPRVFDAFKMDPANASGPIATIIQDLITIIIYFAVATALL